MSDDLVLVDINDCAIGHLGKVDTHQRGLLHRAFSVYVYHDNQLLIQKRQQGKYHSENLWTNACCSHPRYEERLEDAVYCRLQEELGIKPNSITEQFSFIYRTVFENGITEFEYDHVFLSEYNGQINLNMDEASAIRWISIESLAAELVNHPECFTSWFIISAPRIIKIIQQMQKDNG